MSFSEELAVRLRAAFGDRDDVVEKKMFGGLAFMVAGHMCCGVVDNDLMVRVGPESYEKALREIGTRPMDFTDRPMKGFVFVGPEGHSTDETLRDWVNRGVKFVDSLPPKS